MDKYKNKYRIQSTRLAQWDYRWDGSYFITICTADCTHFFGDIGNGIMELNDIGQLAHQFWMKIPQHFPFVHLGNIVVMPNHVHGVLIIDKTTSVETLQFNVSSTTTTNENEQMSKISPKPGSISTIIRSYKSVVTKHARKINDNFKWQPRFHDHIIRNAQSFETIQQYIKANPKKWEEDKFYG